MNRIPRWLSRSVPELPIPVGPIDMRIVQSIDGQRSLGELTQALGLEPALLYSLVYALMVLGYLTLGDSPMARAGARPVGDVPTPIGRQSIAAPRSAYSADAGPTHMDLAPFRSPGRAASTPSKTPIGGGDCSYISASSGYFRTRSRRGAGRGGLDDKKTPGNLAVHQALAGAGKGVAKPRKTNPTMSYRAVMSPNRGVVRPTLSQRAVDGLPRIGHREEERGQSPTGQEQIEAKYVQVMTEDYFHILEITEEAGDLEIRRAYQRLKQSFADNRFSPAVLEQIRPQLKEIQQVLQEAYDVLGEPGLRQHYSQHLGR